MKYSVLSLAACALILASCSSTTNKSTNPFSLTHNPFGQDYTFNGLEPVSEWNQTERNKGTFFPTSGNKNKTVGTVESLQPTLEWKPSPTNDVTYDLIIYTGIRGQHSYDPGKQVYYRENLATTKHTVETRLSPDEYYVWSVRTRKGQTASAWSTFRWAGGEYSGKGWGYMNAVWWGFKTPMQ